MTNTTFNVQPIHVKRLKSVLKIFEVVYIHGDGAMYGGSEAEAKDGSDYHKEFNSGVADINKNEAVARAKFCAKYTRNSVLPTTVDEVIEAFYNNHKQELIGNSKKQVSKKTYLADEDEETPVVEVKKVIKSKKD